MKEFILFMYNDASDNGIANDGSRWGEYLTKLRSIGQFDGGSSIGSGLRARKGYPDVKATPDLNGFIRVRAQDLDAARRLLSGNPVYDGGGTVDVRELLVDE
ncbi:MAG: hypothetical protein ABL921_25890 [Pirellula sp.]